MKKRYSGFTLVEILVVLAIIAILAALILPAFNSAKEKARQTTCASTLSQIQVAVKLYRQDEGNYPDTLLDILGQGMKYDKTGVSDTLGANAPGYFKGSQDSLLCPDDDRDSAIPRSSYGYLSKSVVTLAAPLPTDYPDDLSRFVWNYYGYNQQGFAYQTPAEANTGNPLVAGKYDYLLDTASPYDAANPTKNPVKYSLSNRFAPESTIITHCIYHRVPTASNLNNPAELYASSDNSKYAHDIILRLDGSTNLDVSQWKDKKNWQQQTP